MMNYSGGRFEIVWLISSPNCPIPQFFHLIQIQSNGETGLTRIIQLNNMDDNSPNAVITVELSVTQREVQKPPEIKQSDPIRASEITQSVAADLSIGPDNDSEWSESDDDEGILHDTVQGNKVYVQRQKKSGNQVVAPNLRSIETASAAVAPQPEPNSNNNNNNNNDNLDDGKKDGEVSINAAAGPKLHSWLDYTKFYLKTCLSSILLMNVYISFTIAILLQSVHNKKGFLPVNHEKELQGKFWALGLIYFLILFTIPFILVYALLSEKGLYSRWNNDYSSAIPFTAGFSVYIAAFTVIHCCTIYYAWIRPDLRVIHTHSRVFKWKIQHFLSLFALIFESAQLIAPFLSAEKLGLSSFGSANGADNSNHQYWLNNLRGSMAWTVFSFVGSNYFMVSFWLCFTIVLIYVLLIGYGIVSDLQPTSSISPIVFSFIPGTLYITILSKFFSTFNCKLLSAENNQFVYVLEEATDYICWSAEHKGLLIAACMGLLYYMSSAMFVACYRGDSSGANNPIKFKPLYLVIERTCRGLFALTTTLISESLLNRLLSLILLMTLISFSYKMRPCNIRVLNRLKAASQFAAIWLLSVSFLPDIFRSLGGWWDKNVAIVIISGWLALIVGFATNELRIRRRHRKHREAAKMKRSQQIASHNRINTHNTEFKQQMN
jgi:hypothetical protein